MQVLKNKKKFFYIITLTIGLIFSFIISTEQTSNALSKYGSVSSEVKQIQTSLKNLGYYSGKIDSIYGNITRTAVINFQKAKGLVADGIAGPKTLAALGVNSATTAKYSDSDINLLARVISAEARSEPYSGQVAVGAVVLNRIEHPSFPKTLSGVIYQQGAFSCLVDGQINAPVTDSSKKAATDAINGWDPSGGAIYYYNPSKTTNKFMLSRPVSTVIGNHVFCK